MFHDRALASPPPSPFALPGTNRQQKFAFPPSTFAFLSPPQSALIPASDSARATMIYDTFFAIARRDPRAWIASADRVGRIDRGRVDVISRIRTVVAGQGMVGRRSGSRGEGGGGGGVGIEIVACLRRIRRRIYIVPYR